jgi:CrcB protein
MLLRVLLVAAGGALGSVLRYLAGLGLTALAGEARLPIATLAVNVTGSLALGFVMGAVPEPSLTRLAVTTGLLGGFTTYSAFNFEALELARHGEVPLALGYVALTVGACVVAGFAGALAGDAVAG